MPAHQEEVLPGSRQAGLQQLPVEQLLVLAPLTALHTGPAGRPCVQAVAVPMRCGSGSELLKRSDGGTAKETYTLQEHASKAAASQEHAVHRAGKHQELTLGSVSLTLPVHDHAANSFTCKVLDLECTCLL